MVAPEGFQIVTLANKEYYRRMEDRALFKINADRTLGEQIWTRLRPAPSVCDACVELKAANDAIGQQIKARLTPAQMAIVRLACSPMSNKEIADTLRRSEQVVKNHLRAIYGLLGVESRSHLILLMHQHPALWDVLPEDWRWETRIKLLATPTDTSSDSARPAYFAVARSL